MDPETDDVMARPPRRLTERVIDRRMWVDVLTIGAITGFVRMVDEKQNTSLTKIILTVAVWIVYGVVLHSPINPSFRGKKAAILSVIGLSIMLLTILVVQFV